MSEEDKAPWERITATGSLEDLGEEDIQPDPIVEQALEKGWVPKDQWHGNPDEWRDAKEYMDRSSFFEKINNQKREIDRYKQDLDAVKEHLQKLRASQIKADRDRLEQEKLHYLQEGEFDRVLEVDRELRKVEEEVAPVIRHNPDSDPLFQEWVQDNDWYERDPDLRSLADGFGISYRQNNPQARPEDVYRFVTDAVKRTNPQKFGTTAGAPQSQPRQGSTVPERQNSGPKYTYRDLGEDELRVGRRFVKLGLYKNIQEYIDELANLG